ncbi:SEC-C metal-binding domain-containing protein, partial [Lysobacter sp. A3-1-A15]
EYKKEAYQLFSDMLDKVKREVVTLLARVRIRSEEEVAALEAQERAQAEAKARQMQFQHASAGGYSADEEAEQAQQRKGGNEQFARVGRNEPCPCGSGKKYKHCHGQLA